MNYPTARRRRKPKRTRPALALALVAILACALIGGMLLFRSCSSAPAISGPPYVIALDAGHGGNDVGAVGLVQEVDLTELTVEHLYRLLEADPNFTLVLCRQPGAGAGVNERAQAARRQNAVLLLSIHGNADADGATQSNGFECYPVPPGRTWHAQSLAFAKLVAGEMHTAGARLRGEGGIRYLYYTTATDKFICEAGDTTVRPEKSFGVLEQPNCIALLAEQCFVTSPTDVEAFAGDAGCARAAQCYYRALCTFFGTEPATGQP